MSNSLDDIKLCVIIPTYNNAGTIRDVVESAWTFCKDIIVVDDGCTDATGDMLRCCRYPLTVVSSRRNRGKGHALVEGLRKAMEMGYSHAVTMDADGQHFASDIPVFAEQMKICPKAIVIGRRDLSEKNIPRGNIFANKFSNFWFRLQTGVALEDTQCGFRLYPLSELPWLSLITSRYEAELELLVLSAWRGTRIIPVPVKVYYPPGEERVTHFRPIYDFARISVLNVILCIGAIVYGLPRRAARGIKRLPVKSALYVIRQAAYSIFYFCYFLGLTVDLTVRGFFLLTVMGNTEKNKRRYHRLLCSKARFVINNVPGTRFGYDNRVGEKFLKPSIIICNHQSHLDLMAIMMLTPNLIILTKDWVWRNTIYGLVIRYADYISVTDRERMKKKIRERIAKGYSVVVFPEGTRSADGRIGRFHRGAFKMAEDLSLDIVPVFISGMGNVLPKTSFFLRPGRMAMEVLPRLTSDDAQWKDGGYRSVARTMHKIYLRKNEEVRNNR